MKQTSIDDPFKTGLIKIDRSVEKDDRLNGVDGWLDGDIPIAFRKRPYLTIQSYEGKVITIRIGKGWIRGWQKFEYDKLLSGQFRAILYFFKFQEHLIIIPVKDIVDYLSTKKLGELDISPNTKGQADLIAIHPDELENALIVPLNMPFNLETK